MSSEIIVLISFRMTQIVPMHLNMTNITQCLAVM